MVVEKDTSKTPTKTNRITIILSDEERDLLRLLKKKTGKTASTVIRDGITLFLKRYLKEQELLKQLDD